ncbi:AraC family transcriptional regulator [Chitinophaga horti]|uniref:AraC family transcriptional regulator n=1 Tax=Chitinophaga horti TaxID=2920382 RepID=A0ABY6J633_9BACT|nr:AraC family transcriptional regulator [Chitinophaga horti]UYQ94816.1 AraC family transcriptional regulator [Chitinophaga horti]
MNNYYKYLPVSAEDKKWGLYVLNAGCNRVEKEKAYPSGGHPPPYSFSWESGRVLHEFQLIYLSHGKGTFESASCPLTEVNEGSVFLLFPYEWHRYKPDSDTGWDEWWTGCKGPVLDNLLRRGFFSPAQPLLHIGYNEEVTRLFQEIIDQSRDEKPGYQPLISGAVLHLFGLIHSLSRQGLSPADEGLVAKARLYLRAHLTEDISFEALSAELQVSYSSFRKAFKLHTGMPPHQYLLELRMEKARQLLSGSDLPVKAIAVDAGFESAFYFSKMFRKKMGLTPGEYRKQMGR